MDFDLAPEDESRTVDKLVPDVFHEMYPHLVPVNAVLMVEAFDPELGGITSTFVRSYGMGAAHEFGLHHLRAQDIKDSWRMEDDEWEDDD